MMRGFLLYWKECKFLLALILSCLDLTGYSIPTRMVLAAVYCLMIGHPGFVFKPEESNPESVHSQHELQETEYKAAPLHL